MLSSIFRGEASLPRTFWLYFVFVYIGSDLLQAVLIGKGAPPALISLFVFGFAVYLPLILIGVWRSAGYYDGNHLWAMLARLVAGFYLIVFALRLFGWVLFLVGR